MRRNTSVEKRFSSAATTYGEYAGVQARVASDLIRWIDASDEVSRVLEIGCGTGIFTELLLDKFPNARIDAVDVSPKMIEVAGTRLSDSSRVNWAVGDASYLEGDASYDLIASNCAIHWMNPSSVFFDSLASCLVKEKQLLFSVMLEGTLASLHGLREELFPDNCPEEKLRSLRSFVDSLQGAGFSSVETKQLEYQETYESAYQMLRSLNKLGVTGGQFSRGVRPLSRREIRLLCGELEARYGDAEGRVAADYVVGIFRCSAL